MSTLVTLLTTAMGLVFLVWAFEMFRMLFRISRRAKAKLGRSRGGYADWAGHSLTGYRWFFTAPDTRSHRNRVIVLTLLLMALVIARPLLGV